VTRAAASPHGNTHDQELRTLRGGDSRRLGARARPIVHRLLKLQAIVARVDDRLATNRDATGFGLGFEYYLSKRTDLYGRHGDLKNQNGATLGLDNENNGSHPQQLALGIRRF
jgi:predicted porin